MRAAVTRRLCGLLRHRWTGPRVLIITRADYDPRGFTMVTSTDGQPALASAQFRIAESHLVCGRCRTRVPQ